MSTAGNLLALILSKTVKASYLHIVNDIPLLLGFSFIIFISVVCASILLLIPFRLVKLNVAESCAFERGTSSDLHFGEVCIYQRNICTNKRGIVKLQLDTILDIRLESPGWRNGWKFTIGLITSQQLESICIYHSSLPGVDWEIDPSKVGVKFQATINSLNRELELTRDFLYLSPKPAYLNKVISNSIFPELHKLYHLLKILDETSSNLTYKLTHSLSPYGETWNFNSDSGIVTVQYRYFVKISTKSIAMDTIQEIAIERELISPVDGIYRFFSGRSNEKYSAILLIEGKDNCERIFTSSSLSDVKDFVDRVNYHIDRSRQTSKV